VAEARDELDEASAERGWSRSWSDRSYTPDYGPLTQCLQALVAAGAADEVLALGIEIMEAGTLQVEESDDEGETGDAIRGALAVVWETLSHSSLSPAQRILWMYDRYLEDDFTLTNGTDELSIWNVEPTIWSEVAEKLLVRTGLRKAEDGREAAADDSDWDRTRLTRWAVDALASAGRLDEALCFALGAAKDTVGCSRKVELLIQAGRLDEAKAIAREGIRKAAANRGYGAAELRGRLLDIAESERDRALVAAFRADQFADSPSIGTYWALREAAQAVDMWPTVRAAALDYLRSGARLVDRPDWPLPDTGCSPTKYAGYAGFPMTGLLIEVALDEEDHEAAAKLYDGWRPKGAWEGLDIRRQLAAAVAATHPDTSIAVWRDLAEDCIDEANRNGYERSVPYLKLAQQLLRKLGRGAEWDEYITSLRVRNKRRWALIQTLEVLDEQ